jgi:nitrous oxide reductase accessory protein NosL
MKTLLITLLAILSLSACRKCEDCTITTWTRIANQNEIKSTTVTELCGDDLKDANGHESHTTTTVNGYTTTIRTLTVCQ